MKVNMMCDKCLIPLKGIIINHVMKLINQIMNSLSRIMERKLFISLIRDLTKYTKFNFLLLEEDWKALKTIRIKIEFNQAETNIINLKMVSSYQVLKAKELRIRFNEKKVYSKLPSYQEA
jgi:hypothetical protein